MGRWGCWGSEVRVPCSAYCTAGCAPAALLCCRIPRRPNSSATLASPKLQVLEPLASEVEALRAEVSANDETLTDCLTSLGQEEAKVGGWVGGG